MRSAHGCRRQDCGFGPGDGTVKVVAVGVAWHAGVGMYRWLPTSMGNWHLIGIQCPNSGTNPTVPTAGTGPTHSISRRFVAVRRSIVGLPTQSDRLSALASALAMKD
jgi:hypothetical protein